MQTTKIAVTERYTSMPVTIGSKYHQYIRVINYVSKRITTLTESKSGSIDYYCHVETLENED